MQTLYKYSPVFTPSISSTARSIPATSTVKSPLLSPNPKSLRSHRINNSTNLDQMTASATMQSMIFLPTPAAKLSSKPSQNLASLTPRLQQHVQRKANYTVSCSVQEPKETMPGPDPVTPVSKPTPSITDLLEFSSPAPERINGRLAMLGFVSAIGAEILSGQDVFSQLSHGEFQLFLGTSILFSIASFVPFLKGVDVESKSEGFMNSDAELLNGRLAMLGSVALAVTEFAKGGTLV